MIKQLLYFIQDYKKAVGRKRLRALYMWMSWGVLGVFFYRIERGLFLLFRGGVYVCSNNIMPVTIFNTSTKSRGNQLSCEYWSWP